MDTVEKLDRDFKNACRIVLGGEIGELKDFEEYLSRYIEKTKTRKSFFSGEELEAMSYYPDSSRFVKEEEIPKIKVDPVSIDEVKDIDSLFEAAEERLFFVGNSILGNSHYVEESTTVNNSSFIFRCANMLDCQNCAYSSFAIKCKYLFGTHDSADSSFVIKSIGFGGNSHVSRVFESNIITHSSNNIYYSYFIKGCSECFFSFFQNGKRYLIGNLQLERERYIEIKECLLEQIRSELETKKTIKGIHDIVETYSKEEPRYIEEEILCPETVKEAFRKTFSIVFGKPREVKDIRLREPNYYDIQFIESQISGERTPVGMVKYYRYPKKTISRFVSERDATNISKRSIREEEISKDFERMASSLNEIAFYSVGIGSNSTNVFPQIVAYYSFNSYMDVMPVLSKNTAFNFWPRDSANAFFCSTIIKSTACISCVNSNMLNRCYDCDFMRNCSDSYMAHNCENCRDVVLCSSLKSKRNCVVNTQFSQEEYKKVKEYLLEWINGELNSKGTIPISMLDVFSGEWRKKG